MYIDIIYIYSIKCINIYNYIYIYWLVVDGFCLVFPCFFYSWFFTKPFSNVELIHPNFLITHQEIHPGNDTLKKKNNLNSSMLNYLSLWINETHIQTSHPNRLVEILWPYGELMGSPWITVPLPCQAHFGAMKLNRLCSGFETMGTWWIFESKKTWFQR